MKLPWQKSKKAQIASTRERSDSGQFLSQNPPVVAANKTFREVQAENQVLGTTISTMDSMMAFMNKFDELVERKVESRLEGLEEGAGDPESGWLPILKELAPYIGPQLPGLIEKFTGIPAGGSGNAGEQEGSPSPSPPSPAPSPPSSTGSQESIDIAGWISTAAKLTPGLIKPFIPDIEKELEKRNMNPQEFKQAIINLSKAYK
jgi:hypothetical protein